MIVLYNPRSTSGRAPLPMSLLSLASLLEDDWEIVDGNSRVGHSSASSTSAGGGP